MYDPTCVVKVQPDDNLIVIAARVADETVDPETIKAENGLASNVINLGQLLDVCVDNGINDVTGEARGERNAVIVQREVMAQQAKLNELFAGYGIRELLVDGVRARSRASVCVRFGWRPACPSVLPTWSVAATRSRR